MTRRLARLALALYPRRVRRRYGAELAELGDELRARGEISRGRLLGDLVWGAVAARRWRWPPAVAATGAVLAALAVAGLALPGHGETARRAPRPRHTTVADVLPFGTGTCFVAAGNAPCSLQACTEFVRAEPLAPADPQRTTRPGCTAYPRVTPRRPVPTRD